MYDPQTYGQGGLRGAQDSMVNYLSGMLGQGLSVNGLRALSESLAAADRESTQRYGIDAQAHTAQMDDSTRRYGIDTNYDMNVNDNAMRRYGTDSQAASQDYGTLAAHSVLMPQNGNPFRNGGASNQANSFSLGGPVGGIPQPPQYQGGSYLSQGSATPVGGAGSAGRRSSGLRTYGY